MADERFGGPDRVLILGRPGAGKGTQGIRLAEVLGVPHISTGDIFREAMTTGTLLGRDVAAYLERGRLVPDPLVVRALASRLEGDDARTRGFVLDGFPRTVAQAEALEQLVAPGRISRAVELILSEREATQRLLTRFVCAGCGHTVPRSVESGRQADLGCARCGGALLRRADDDLPAIERRLQEFERATRPLLEWLDLRGLLVTVDADRAPEVVAASVLDAIDPCSDQSVSR
jgi:adenylate kinase